MDLAFAFALALASLVEAPKPAPQPPQPAPPSPKAPGFCQCDAEKCTCKRGECRCVSKYSCTPECACDLTDKADKDGWRWDAVNQQWWRPVQSVPILQPVPWSPPPMPLFPQGQGGPVCLPGRG